VGEARAAIAAARKVLQALGVELHPQKTRIVHVALGFEGSSTGSTAGLCGAFGRIDSSAGGMVAGDSCRKPSCTASIN